MTGFLYFVPAEKSAVNERQATLVMDKLVVPFGLEHVFQLRQKAPDQTVFHYCDGPDDTPGYFLYPKPHVEHELPACSYLPERQVWWKFRNFWIGIEKDNPPEPADLRHDTLMLGYEMDDETGGKWMIPIIKSPRGAQTIPLVQSFDENGDYVTKIRDQDEEIWEIAGRLQDYMQLRTEMTDEEVARGCLKILQLNYYVGVPEIFAFAKLGREIVSTYFCARIIAACADFPMYEEAQKKTEPASSEVPDSANA